MTFLASEACTFTHETFSAAGGRYARVFIGLAPGWYGGKDHVPTAEDVLDNLAQIENQDGYIVPTASSDELGQLRRPAQRLTLTGGRADSWSAATIPAPSRRRITTVVSRTKVTRPLASIAKPTSYGT